MKKLILVLPLSIILILNGFAQSNTPKGTVIEGMAIKSTILNRDVEYNIYLPPDYFSAQRRYPVVYLLHGYTGSEIDWVQFGEANRIADKLIANQEIPDMIIVMPDGKNDWYMNTYDGKVRYEDFFIKELIPYIDSAYQTRPERAYRGISGLSMGGNGATLLAMKHTDLFVSCAGLSSAFFTEEEAIKSPDNNYDYTFAQLYGRGLKGKDRINETFKNNSPINLLDIIKLDDLKKVKWYFDCGDDDFLYKGNAALHVAMSDKKIPHEFRMRDGAHTWEYWRTGLPDALKFIGNSFKH